MKKIILCFLVFIIFSSKAFAEKVDYETIYSNLPVIDLYYEQNEDPNEQEDYAQYFNSPYPLIRTSFPLSCKTVKLKQGYYLLTIRSKDGFDFVMFKQNGKIAALIPVYEKRLMTQEETQRLFPPPPKSKHPVLSLPWKGFKAGVKKTLGKYQKPPELPKFALDADIVGGGKYFEILFYKEKYLYKMLFKIER